MKQVIQLSRMWNKKGKKKPFHQVGKSLYKPESRLAHHADSLLSGDVSNFIF
jgi:hypothetical protein